ncbi:hypothetical protein RBSWK_00615 [Rhodopirellula baltica SWK14]|uniref:Uncharacterized protein n=1 Tax=Rhodopirellula baltica SWK14 TaxID=993516 RepID=L7CPE0_RHOBT|nr:hypothetical protein RBSWK_00615 [Rhodopirellula baltica SWK14]
MHSGWQWFAAAFADWAACSLRSGRRLAARSLAKRMVFQPWTGPEQLNWTEG